MTGLCWENTVSQRTGTRIHARSRVYNLRSGRGATATAGISVAPGRGASRTSGRHFPLVLVMVCREEVIGSPGLLQSVHRQYDLRATEFC